MPAFSPLQPITEQVTLFAIDVLVNNHNYPVGNLIENELGTDYTIYIGCLGKLVLHVKQENGVIVPVAAKLDGRLLPEEIRPTGITWDTLTEMYIWMAQVRVYCYMKMNFA